MITRPVLVKPRPRQCYYYLITSSRYIYSLQKPQYLTKSLFKKACECPRKLIYSKHQYPTTSNTPFLQNLANEGKKVGKYARLFYPNGIEIIGSVNNNKSNDIDDLVQETNHYLTSTNNSDDEDTILFEGAIRHGPYLIRADILHKLSNTKELRLMEVKSKSWDSTKDRLEVFLGKRRKNIKSDYLSVLLDVAFQKMVAQLAFPNWNVTAWLIMPDKAKKNQHCSIPNNLNQLVVNGGTQNSVPSESSLLTEVFVDDIIEDYILQNEKIASLLLGVPTDNNNKAFQQIVEEWSALLLSSDTATTTMEIGHLPLLPKPVLGNSCKSCEYRVSLSKINDHTTTNYNNNNNSEHATTSKEGCAHANNTTSDKVIINSSGFDLCWEQVTGENLRADEYKKKTPVVDLYYGGKTSSRLLSKGKYYMSDIRSEDLGLATDDKKKKKRKTSKKKKAKTSETMSNHDDNLSSSSEGMSRAQRQWYQVLDETRETTRGGSNTKICNHNTCQHDDDNNNNDNHETNNPLIKLDRGYLAEKMEQWKYPYHFIDFETITPVLPYFQDMSPYEMIAFQFSHHILYENGQVQHKTQFLHAQPPHCPNPLFLQALHHALFSSDNNTNIGTIFSWGKHEHTVLSSLLFQKQNQQQEPQDDDDDDDDDEDGILALQSLLSGQENSMVDLMEIATKGYYVTGSGGSSSLKNVLLPTMVASPKLKQLYGSPSYISRNFTKMQWWKEQEENISVDSPNHLLHLNFMQQHKQPRLCDPYSLLWMDDGEYYNISTASTNAIESEANFLGSITHGGDAMAAYQYLLQDDMSASMRTEIESLLYRYCELDTLAMAMIVQAWQGFLED